MFHTSVEICKFSSVSLFTRYWLWCSSGIMWGGVVWVSDQGTSMAGEVLGWFLGLLLWARPWMEVLTDVRQGQLQMDECWKAVCLMVKGSGEVAGGVCASMHDTHKIRRVVVESGEHYGWFALWLVHGGAGQTCGVLKDAIMVVESGPHKIWRVVVESGKHYGWFMKEQEDKLVEFRMML